MDPVEKRAEEILFGAIARMAVEKTGPPQLEESARRRMERNSREMARRLEDTGSGGTSVASDPTGLMDTLTTAMQRRNVVSCPHFENALLTGEVVAVNFGRREAFCPICFDSSAVPDDDGLCDICNEPTDLFTAFNAVAYTIYYHADVCPDCATHLESLGHGGRAPAGEPLA